MPSAGGAETFKARPESGDREPLEDPVKAEGGEEVRPAAFRRSMAWLRTAIKGQCFYNKRASDNSLPWARLLVTPFSVD